MSETKTYVFPESGNSGGGGMMAMLAPLLQQKGIDPNLLVAMQGKNNNGFGGDGSWFMWIIFLFFLFPLSDAMDLVVTVIVVTVEDFPELVSLI